jgi:L-lactate utilization protein LutB
MEKHLLAFEQNLISKGIQVFWVTDENELNELIIKSFNKPSNNKIAFDIPVIPKEFLEKKSLFKQVSIKEFEDFHDQAEHLVVKANFGVVETGSLVLIDKPSKSCFNKVENLHIILDINNLVVKQNDLEPLLFLLNIDKQNSPFPKDIKIIAGLISQIVNNTDFASEEKFNTKPVKVSVYFYDNGITTILEDTVLRESLYCIDCGKCKDVCPVYKHTQNFTPIGLVYNNCFEENRKTTQIFENTSLCGNCNEVCPVLIPLTDLMIFEMQKAKNKHSRERNIDLFKYFARRARMNKLNSWYNKYFFIKKQYSKNKRLANYFKQQKLPFFNLKMSHKNENND